MRHPGPRLATAALLPLLLGPGASARAQGRAIGPLSAFDAQVVEFAREGARSRLGSPECRKLLSDFTDAGGRTLALNLRRFDVAPDEYLAMLPILDGATRPLCQAGRSELLTTAGVPRVFVCKAFLRTVSERREMAEVYLIHEMLHTLGLGENPPSSQEITRQVVRRCAP